MIRKTIDISSIKIMVLLSILSMSMVMESFAQEAIKDKPVRETYESYDTKREEIQRYFGYELLLYRYLSTPYDININTTQQSNFVEIGFLFILFLPVLILLLVRHKKTYYYLFLAYMIFLWIISTSNSFVFSHQKLKVKTTESALENYISEIAFSIEPLDVIVGRIHLASRAIYAPLESIGNAISGDSDHITYPFLFLLFVLISLFLLKITRNYENNFKYFIGLTWLYGFYWLTFGGGIVWYGYILLPLLYLLIIKLFDELREKEKLVHKYLYITFVILGCFWILIASVDRVSNVKPNITAEKLGQGIFNPTFFDYSTGKITKSQVIEKMYGKIDSALERMNADKDSYIWRVGTSMTYFIENNNKRVVMDNQLGLFHPLNYTYPDKQELVEVMKASNFKFLIMDLNTATIDQTPNKTLTKKYKALEEFVKDNPKVKLLATDRLIAVDNGGKVGYAYGLYGQVAYTGRYAVFEFL